MAVAVAHLRAVARRLSSATNAPNLKAPYPILFLPVLHDLVCPPYSQPPQQQLLRHDPDLGNLVRRRGTRLGANVAHDRTILATNGPVSHSSVDRALCARRGTCLAVLLRSISPYECMCTKLPWQNCQRHHGRAQPPTHATPHSQRHFHSGPPGSASRTSSHRLPRSNAEWFEILCLGAASPTSIPPLSVLLLLPSSVRLVRTERCSGPLPSPLLKSKEINEESIIPLIQVANRKKATGTIPRRRGAILSGPLSPAPAHTPSRRPYFSSGYTHQHHRHRLYSYISRRGSDMRRRRPPLDVFAATERTPRRGRQRQPSCQRDCSAPRSPQGPCRLNIPRQHRRRCARRACCTCSWGPRCRRRRPPPQRLQTLRQGLAVRSFRPASSSFPTSFP